MGIEESEEKGWSSLWKVIEDEVDNNMAKDDKENHKRNGIDGEMQNEHFADCIGRVCCWEICES